MINKICKACGAEFPNWMGIDGKWRNLQSRSYCLSCSAFGSHNTKKLGNDTGVDPNRKKPVDGCRYCGRKDLSGVKLGAHTVHCPSNPNLVAIHQKIALAQTGKKLSEETKQKLREINKRRVESNSDVKQAV